MAITFRNIEPKTGDILGNIPDRVAEHTYLERRLQQAQTAGTLPKDLTFYVAKLYDSVTAADLEHLRQKHNLHAIGSNRRSGYFVADQATAEWIRSEIFTNHSDPVAYFSVAMSHAVASTVQPNARVLVMDDGQPSEAKATQKWGEGELRNRSGQVIDPGLLSEAHQKLGDGYCLITPDLHRQVVRNSTVEQAHQAVEEGKLAMAQVYTLSGAELDQWEPDLIKELLSFHVEEAIGRSLAVNEDKALSPTAMPDSPLQISTLNLEQDAIRGQVATARWRYTDLTSHVTYTGRVMLEQHYPEGELHLMLIGGNYQQKQAVATTFHTIVTSDLTPFQLRGGVPKWKGAFKGTSRAASLCEALGVDAVIPKSAIKADGKTVPLGISGVSELFWARKSDARVGLQQLGTQVLVNLPEGTRADILPKLQSRQETLVEAMGDPRRLADLYCQQYERRQQFLQDQAAAEEVAGGKATEQGDFKTAQTKAAKSDWLYTLLKADARPQDKVTAFDAQRWLNDQTQPSSEGWKQQLQSAQLNLWQQKLEGITTQLEQETVLAQNFPSLLADTLQVEVAQLGNLNAYVETTQIGGYAQILEMPKVLERLYEFAQAEWKDGMTGGVLVPSATAQPHALLQPGEVCFPGMPHGARLTGYRSPVANVGQMKMLVNNLTALKDKDPEAFMQQGVVYLNPTDAKEMVIDFDIDSVGLIPDEEYVRAKAIAGPARALKEGQCFVPSLPEGQAITLYHQGQVVNLVNTDIALPEDAARGEQAIYLNRKQYQRVDPKQPLHYGFYDGLHGFKGLNDEVEYLTHPDRCPTPVEKRTKIPRDPNHPDVAKLSASERQIAASFTSLEQAMIHAADNPTGMVANVGMKLQALKQHLAASDEAEQVQQVRQAARTFKELLEREGQESPDRPTFYVPEVLEDYDFRTAMTTIAQFEYSPAAKCLEQVPTLQELLEVVQHQLVDPELQTAVETDKSSRPVNPQITYFAQALSSYQAIDWVKEKKRPELYKPQYQITTGEVRDNPIPISTTHDPIGLMVRQNNSYYRQCEVLMGQHNQAFNGLLPQPDGAELAQLRLEARQAVAQYNRAIAQAHWLKEQAQINPGPKLQVEVEGLSVPLSVTNLSTFDPTGECPVWQQVRQQEPFCIQIVENTKDQLQGIAPKDSQAWRTQGNEYQGKAPTHQYQVVGTFPDGKGVAPYSIGTLDAASEQALREQGMTVKGLSNRPLALSQLSLEPNYDRDHADDLITQAEEQIQAWIEQASQVHGQEQVCQALYHSYGKEAGQQGIGHTGTYLAMRAFPDLMVPHLQEFSLTQSRVTALDYYTDHLGWDAQWQGQAVPVRVAVLDDPNLTTHGRAIWQVGVDEPVAQGYRRNWYTLGLVNQNNLDDAKQPSDSSYRLPVGAEAIAQISAVPGRYEAVAQDGTRIDITPSETGRHRLEQHDPNQPIQLSFQKAGKDWRALYHPPDSSRPVDIGRMGQAATRTLAVNPPMRSLPVTSYALKPLPVKAAVINVLPQSVRLDPEQWVMPSLKSWQAFAQAQESQPSVLMSQPAYPRAVVVGQEQCSTLLTPMQPPTPAVFPNRSTDATPVTPVVLTPAPPAPAANSPAALYQQRYQATLEQVMPAIQKLQEQSGSPLSPKTQDMVIAMHLLRQAVKHDPNTDLQAASTEVIRTLSQSPHAQSLLLQQGKPAMCEYLDQQIKEARKAALKLKEQLSQSAQPVKMGGR